MKFDEVDQRTLEIMAEYGHEVIYVFPTEEDDDGVPFAYTVGRSKEGRPELLITGGLPQNVVGIILNDAAKRDDETPLEAGTSVDKLIRGFSMKVVAADPVAAEMNMATRFFGPDIEALQLVWPDTQGRFPGDEGYEFETWKQPLFPKGKPVASATWLDGIKVSVDDQGKRFYLQIDGNDIVSITDIDRETGSALVTVHQSTRSDANPAWGGVVNIREHLEEAENTCRHCGRRIILVKGRWIDPEATGDDRVWRKTCDAHDTVTAEHEPEDDR